MVSIPSSKWLQGDNMHIKYLPKAIEVSNFLMKLRITDSRGDDFTDSKCKQDFAYGKALEHWEDNGSDPEDFFSTEDSWLLVFSEELEEKFGLEIISHEAALARHRVSKMDYKVSAVDGIRGPFTWSILPGEA
jgi:hypothetical protein